LFPQTLKPILSPRFRSDRKDLHPTLNYIVENPDFTYPEAIPRMTRFPQALDAAPARLGRLVTEMNLHGITDSCTIMRTQSPQVLHRLWG
jgi:hypothetical protein